MFLKPGIVVTPTTSPSYTHSTLSPDGSVKSTPLLDTSMPLMVGCGCVPNFPVILPLDTGQLSAPLFFEKPELSISFFFTTAASPFSFSFALNNKTTLTATDHVLKHYWENKKAWDSAYEKFCLDHPSFADRLKNFNQFDLNIPLKSTLPPRTFLEKQKNSIRKRWLAFKGGVRK